MVNSVIGHYINGNYKVLIMSDGTKIRYNDLDLLIPERPESIDIKITNSCDMGCQYCHEDSVIDGAHGDIMDSAFIRKLKPYTELAIGGGNPLSHPDLISFLRLCKDKELIPSMTVNQHHFTQNYKKIKLLADRELYGIGVSVTNVNDRFINTVKMFDNAVIHIIAGVISEQDLKKLYDHDLKLLILGYKNFRRGKGYYSDEVQKRIESIKVSLSEIVSHFQTVSFDNLAIKQLNVKNIVPEWDQFYMGDDGQFTMYVDMVKHEFAVNSTSETRYKYSNEDIETMFQMVRRNHL